MRHIRATAANKAFDDALGRQDEVARLIEIALAAARGGQLDELDAILERIASTSPSDVRLLEPELHAIVRSLRSHPSYSHGRGG